MKNRTRESCTSGSVRDEDGNILIYSARLITDGAAHSEAGVGVRNPPAGTRGKLRDFWTQMSWE